MFPRFLLIPLALFQFACGSPPMNTSSTTPNQTAVNKDIAIEFYRDVIGQRDESLVDQFITDDYIQHNPMVKTGKRGFLETLAFLKQMPPPRTDVSPIIRIIAEEHFVALHLAVEIGGKETVVLDLFRLSEGKLAEHWDAIEVQPLESLNSHTMTDGEREILDHHLTDENKSLVSNYYRDIWIDGNTDRLQQYFSPDLVQHIPEIADGLSGLENYFREHELSLKKVHRVIGEGNFVLAQLEVQLQDNPFVFYEILRIADGKIAEQWRVKQQIPETMAHSNGMI